MELGAVHLVLLHLLVQLKGFPLRVQSDNATVVEFINLLGGTRSWVAQEELHVPRLSTMHIPGEKLTRQFYLTVSRRVGFLK